MTLTVIFDVLSDKTGQKIEFQFFRFRQTNYETAHYQSQKDFSSRRQVSQFNLAYISIINVNNLPNIYRLPMFT